MSPPVRKLTLDEARQRFNREEERRRSVESKIATVITVDALVISIVGVYSPLNDSLRLSMIVALISAGVGLWALRSRHYVRPGKDIDDFRQYDNLTEDEQRKKLLIDYIVAIDGNENAANPRDRITGNRKRHDNKYLLFDICTLLTGGALLLIIVNPVCQLLS